MNTVTCCTILYYKFQEIKHQIIRSVTETNTVHIGYTRAQWANFHYGSEP